MSQNSERINCAISNAELERRWRAVRTRMQERGIDVLYVRNSNDFLGGYVKWFTDVPATTGYPTGVVFPLHEDMTIVAQGTFGMDRRLKPEGDGPYRGVHRMLGAPGYASVHYTSVYEAHAMERALQPYAKAVVGIVGPASHSLVVMDHLRRTVLSNATVVDATDLVDEIKSVKSHEEIELIRKTARMQDECMYEVIKQVRPGMRDCEVTAIAQHVGQRLGSEQGIFLCASAPQGTAVPYGIRHYQNRTIREGDYLNLLIENNGPGGFYTELGRMCVFGKASEQMHAEMAFVRRAQNFAASLLKPGASCAQIWRDYNAFLVENGRPAEQRLFCHGQGYDLVERPLVRDDEPFAVQANMNFACHPSYATAAGFFTLCDNFLVTDTGVERLHSFPPEIVEL
jgi:Xaa-Pro aminopeptidase